MDNDLFRLFRCVDEDRVDSLFPRQDKYCASLLLGMLELAPVLSAVVSLVCGISLFCFETIPEMGKYCERRLSMKSKNHFK